LNKLGGKHGVGRVDMVENRYVGMKSAACMRPPAARSYIRASPDGEPHDGPRVLADGQKWTPKFGPAA